MDSIQLFRTVTWGDFYFNPYKLNHVKIFVPEHVIYNEKKYKEKNSEKKI
jgi:hypothetical protein